MHKDMSLSFQLKKRCQHVLVDDEKVLQESLLLGLISGALHRVDSHHLSLI